MRLSRPLKLALGAATIWVTLYPLLFLAVWLLMALGIAFAANSAPAPSAGPPPLFLIPFFAIFPLHCMTIVLLIGLQVIYLILAIKNTALPDTLRIVFGVGAFFMPFVAMPVYYVLCVWRETPPRWALKPG